MTNDRDPNEKKELPGWAITLIIIASLIVLIVLHRMIRQLLRMRTRKLSGIESINVTPQIKARAFKRAQQKADRQAQKELNRIKMAQTIQVQNAQNKKTRDFQNVALYPRKDFKIYTSRKNTLFTRASYSDKVHASAVLCISWSTPMGLSFEHTILFLGKASKKRLVELCGTRLK